MNHCVGPCLKPMLAICHIHILLCVFFFFFPILTATCSAGESSLRYPSIIWVCIVGLGFVQVLLFEPWCLKFSTVPYAQLMRSWTKASTWQIVLGELNVWCLMQSLVAFIGMLTPCLFSGIVIKQSLGIMQLPGDESCYSGIAHNAIWNKVLSESDILGALLGPRRRIPLAIFVFVFFAFQFFPVLYCFWKVLPRCPSEWQSLTFRVLRKAEVQWCKDTLEWRCEPHKFDYSSVLSKTQTHDSYYMLAEGAGMCSITAQSITYPFTRCEQLIAACRQEHSQNTHTLEHEKRELLLVQRGLKHFSGIFSRLFLRVFLTGFLASGLQLQIQITFLAMDMVSTSPHATSITAQCQVFVAIVSAFLRSCQVFSPVLKHHQKLADLQKLIEKERVQEQKQCWSKLVDIWWQLVDIWWPEWLRKDEPIESDELLNEVKKLRLADKKRVRTATRERCHIMLFVCLCGANLVWCIFKALALYVCKDHMWNWTGCVDLSAFRCFPDKSYHPAAHPECPPTDPCCQWQKS